MTDHLNAFDSDARRSPDRWAAVCPDRVAIAMTPSGRSLTYGELDEHSSRVARVFRSCGLGVGDHVAIAMENRLEFLVVAWAAQRSGLYYTPVNHHLTTDEVAYVINDCGARALVASRGLAARLPGASVENVEHRFVVAGAGDPPDDDDFSDWTLLDRAMASEVPTRIADETEGRPMLYSSGTTSRPKGVLRPIEGVPFGHGLAREMELYTESLQFAEEMVYLSPGPLYHTAPLMACLAVHRLGGTAVVMERFDAQECLSSIEEYQVTHGQWVPTMFVRMLKLDPAVRSSYELSSLQLALHAAAPCPIDVKRQMIDWWGPILLEFYSGTEGGGMTAIASDEWLEHPGSVGRPVGGSAVHITDDDGRELPPGAAGLVWFSGLPAADFHNDPERTAASRNERGWSTLGDVGYLDRDGYLYLTDRASHMIVSAGVNIAPAEIEDVLITHPAVADVAVIGVPDPDRGEQVKAVVQVAEGTEPDRATAEVLLELCRQRLAPYKVPRSIDFAPDLPRTPAGKLMKRRLKDHYWEGHSTRVI